MMQMSARWVSLSALALSAVFASAQAGEAEVRAGLAKLLPDAKPDRVAESEVSGLYEVVIGPQILYMSKDGKYLVQGRILDVAGRKDLTEEKQAAARKKAVDAVGEDKMVIFSPKQYRHTVTVFTDIECGYCRKLHGEMQAYQDEGIRVRYLFFPRAGVGSGAYKEAVAVWCADDRQKAMTDAKAGKEIPMKTCDNPVVEHMELGELIGVSGTPAMVLDDGEMLPGYVPAKRLAAMVDAKKKGN
jgi:thiol:disulfide interchange protein DsbC